jgi:hypothetical protein
MWLPQDQLVAAGDIVVLPSPYAFNVPPRSWAATLRALKNLNYKKLVPGHGAVQTNTSYLDLLIEMADSIADQRDTLLAEGKNIDEIESLLDFSKFKARFTRLDGFAEDYYSAYFEQPFRKAATKALSGKPMVEISLPEKIEFNDKRWQIEAREIEHVEYLGESAIKIKGGTAMLPDLGVQNGLVEFDMAVSEKRGFAGLRFRAKDDKNYEHFYIRPHQSGKPDANQYNPVFNGVAAWQLYHGKDYSVPLKYRYNEWMHIKIIFAGSHAKIYIDSDTAVLHIKDLRHGIFSGGIGLDSSPFSAVHFANFKVTALADAYSLPSKKKIYPKHPKV